MLDVLDVTLQAAAFCCTVTGMAWQALGMEIHWRQVMVERPWVAEQARALRRSGWLALGMALLLCLAAEYATMAALVWVMMLTGSALWVVMLLTWRPARLRRFWRAFLWTEGALQGGMARGLDASRSLAGRVRGLRRQRS